LYYEDISEKERLSYPTMLTPLSEMKGVYTMNKKIYSIDEIKKLIKPIAEMYLLKSVTLFGSYAKGCANENSDVDIYIEYVAGLNRPMFWYGGVYEGIKESLNKEIDILFQGFNRDELAEQVFKDICSTGVIIYEG